MEKTNSFDPTRVMVFDNPEFGKIRTFVDKDGNPYFCGKDVCDALGYRNTSDAVNQHVNIDDIAKRYVRVACGNKADGSPAYKQILMLFVNESGFYALVLGSKLDSAQRFKHWVTSVVLAQIRKTGGYIPLGETDEETIAGAERILRETLRQKDDLIAQMQEDIHRQAAEILDLEHDVDRLLPRALYADSVLDSISCYTTTQIAKELNMTAQELNRRLCALHIQYYQSGQYLLYADYAHQGLAKSRTHYQLFVGPDTVSTRMYLVWTEKGRKFLHELIKN